MVGRLLHGAAITALRNLGWIPSCIHLVGKKKKTLYLSIASPHSSSLGDHEAAAAVGHPVIKLHGIKRWAACWLPNLWHFPNSGEHSIRKEWWCLSMFLYRPSNCLGGFHCTSYTPNWLGFLAPLGGKEPWLRLVDKSVLHFLQCLMDRGQQIQLQAPDGKASCSRG